MSLEPAEGVGAAFTNRYGGVSRPPWESLNLGGGVDDDPAAVAANRRLAATALGIDPDRVLWMRQVHSARVAVVDGPESMRPAGTGEPPDVDAVVTATPGTALAVLVADCAPVLLADPVARVVGAAHAGRQGTAAGVVPATVTAMRGLGAEPARTVAVLGPAICGGCYEVPAALRDEVAAAVPGVASTTRRGNPGLDIRAGIVGQLETAGITRVRKDPRCSLESAELFSYRRDGRTGRFAGYIWLRP